MSRRLAQRDRDKVIVRLTHQSPEFLSFVGADIHCSNSKTDIDHGGLDDRPHVRRHQTGEEAGQEAENNLGG